MNEVDTNVESIQGGKIVFAEDVVATIAYLAAGEVEGVHAMIGSTSISEMLCKKNYTKGVKVEVGTEECACDITIVVKYGYRIQAVAQQVQEEIKNAIETMTGLKVVEVNVNVIVDADALTDEQVAQILDIVLRETGETADNIKVSTAQ